MWRCRLLAAGAALIVALVLGPARAGEEEDKADEALCRDARVGTGSEQTRYPKPENGARISQKGPRSTLLSHQFSSTASSQCS
jgi:hypothetical protein